MTRSVVGSPPTPRSDERHLVFTVGTGVAFAVIWLSFPTQAYLSSSLGAFLCGAVATVVFVDLVVALHLTRLVTTAIDPDRTEILVDEPANLSMAIGGPPLPVALQLGPTRLVVDPAARGPLHMQAGSRGVVAALPVEVRSTGLCGVLGCRRRRAVPLSAAIYVGPRPVTPAQPFPNLGGAWGEGSHLPSPSGDVVRGVRDYVPGDRRSVVHWRASARTGRLVVKELEEPFTPVLVLILDLGASGSPAGEQAAGRAAWYLHEALRRGVKVVLASREAPGLRTAPVDSAPEVIRRLASAVTGPPTPVPGRAPEPPPPWVTAGSSTGAAAAPRPAPAPAPAGPPGPRVLRVRPSGDTWE